MTFVKWNILVRRNTGMALVPFLDEALQYPIFAIIAIGGSAFVGLVQGWILGKALIARFGTSHLRSRLLSAGLLILLLSNAVISLPRFASPEKIRLSVLFESSDLNAVSDAFFTLLGVGTGFLAVFAISVTVLTLIILRIAPIRGPSKAFVIIFSALAMVLTAEARFTYLSPSNLEVLLYFTYQVSIAVGVFLITIRGGRSQSVRKLADGNA